MEFNEESRDYIALKTIVEFNEEKTEVAAELSLPIAHVTFVFNRMGQYIPLRVLVL